MFIRKCSFSTNIICLDVTWFGIETQGEIWKTKGSGQSEISSDVSTYILKRPISDYIKRK